ncbi:MAG TPA: NAD(P)-binding domain-containing protein [Baekduia sp.]|nr:NAD(P)-binding domain-containing protein [Baekduia sp.]
MALAATDLEVAVIGAGPHGMAAGVQLQRSGIDVQVFGPPMSFWESLPRGMTLRSNWRASNLVETQGELSLNAYIAETGDEFGIPVPLEKFVAYGRWVQERSLPGLDHRRVAALRRAGGHFALVLEDGAEVTAARVVIACGIEDMEWLPERFAGLPSEIVSHTGRHPEPAAFAGQEVAVVGGGQSALGSAALMHEQGATVEVFVRTPDVFWLRPREKAPINKMGRLGPILYAPTDVGPLWYSRLLATPDLFRRLPRATQQRIEYRSIRPACTDQIRLKLEGVPLHLSQNVTSARDVGGRVRIVLEDGTEREFDHLMFGTGYRIDVRKHPFLDAELAGDVQLVDGYPVLRRGLESSVPGLHFMGPPAAYSFGPIMRFVSGSWYAARAVTQAVRQSAPRPALAMA